MSGSFSIRQLGRLSFGPRRTLPDCRPGRCSVEKKIQQNKKEEERRSLTSRAGRPKESLEEDEQMCVCPAESTAPVDNEPLVRDPPLGGCCPEYHTKARKRPNQKPTMPRAIIHVDPKRPSHGDISVSSKMR